MKVFEALKQGEIMLKNKGICDYASDARFLMEFFLNVKGTDFILKQREEINDGYFELIEKRISGIPVSYITNNMQFMGLDFFVNEDVLIPRLDTEILVEKAVNWLKSKKDLKIFDICTGSGCIAISVNKLSGQKVTGIDISEKALEVAKINKEKLSADVTFVKDDILNPKTDFKGADLILSNPPYIKTSVIETLDESVKNKEPRLALDGGEDGLIFYRKITSLAKENLNIGGALIFEIGFDQGDDLKQILKENGFCNIEIIKDYNGNDRVAFGEKLK